MESIIVALITGAATILANQVLTKKSLQEKDIEMAKSMQSYADRILRLEQEHKRNNEVVEKLNRIENTVIELKKDIEYIKKG